MEVFYNRGIILKSGSDKLVLDAETAKLPIKFHGIVTHSHSDHSASFASDCQTFSTSASEKLFLESSKTRIRNNTSVLFHEPFETNGFEVELIPAGHLLGAAQVLIRRGNFTILFTGDFCLENLLTVPRATIPKEEIDLLIMETTYGHPSLNLPNRATARMNLLNWALKTLSQGKIPIFNVAQLGGAQELIRLFNEMSDIPILVHERIERISKVYRQEGIPLSYQSLTETSVIDNPNAIILLPRGLKQIPSFIANPYSRAIVTGQSARFPFRKYDYTVALTTHSSCKELVSFVNQIKPKFVLTHYAYSKEFASHLQMKCNISAKPIQLYKERPFELNSIPINGNSSLLHFLD